MIYLLFFQCSIGNNGSHIRYSLCSHGAYLLGEDKVAHIKSDYTIEI